MNATSLRRRVVISSGSLEAVKWLALLAMVTDHANAVFYDRSMTWAVVVGRIALPLFSTVLAYNLARPGANWSGVLKRLLLVGVLSMPLHAPLLGLNGSLWPLNILFTFALGIACISLYQRDHWKLAALLFVVGGFAVDYLWFGPLLLITTWHYFKTQRGDALAMASLSLLALCWYNGNLYALLALPILWGSVTHTVDVPRHRYAFWVAYPLHLAVLLVIAAAL